MEKNNTRTILRWYKADAWHFASGYYCSNCSGYIGKQGKGQRRCPWCKKLIVGEYA